MYNERLKKFIEQIKQKNIETNQADVQGTNGESVFGRVREKETLNNKQNSKTKYIYEDKSRRSANARCYRTEKGETETVISGEAVNYYNCKEKKYRQIDNTLEYRSDKTCDRDFAGYENRYNSFKVRFAEKSASSDLMRVEKDGYELYVKLFEQNLTIRNNAVINRRYNNVSSILQESREKINPLVSGIRYNELYDGVDFEYEVSSTQIPKEILNEIENIRLFSLGATTKEIREKVKAYCREQRREAVKTEKLAQRKTEQVEGILKLPIEFALYKERPILKMEQKGLDLYIELDDLPKLIIRNITFIEREKEYYYKWNENEYACPWTYALESELHFIKGRYEVHFLLETRHKSGKTENWYYTVSGTNIEIEE